MRDYEVIVMGGGPAGATAAAVLAQHGRRVAVLEKERFPRYHIGESLMPYCYFPLERSGALAKIQQSHFPKKYSVQFVSMSGKVSQPFYFFQHLDHECSTTWQVLRGEFDQILLDNAREKGAEVFEQTRATEILRENGLLTGVRAKTASGEIVDFRAPAVIDATGRDALTASRSKWRVFDDNLKKVSIWTYFKGALRDPGIDEAATTIAYLPDKGWFWYIPLPDDVVGVGFVSESDYAFSENRDLGAILAREAEKNPWVKERIAPGAQFGPYYATGEFTYRSRYSAAQGLVLVGDAFAFLDPVFSSGVYLALESGVMAADTMHAALAEGDLSSERFCEYSEKMCRGLEAMRNLVYAFYDHDFNVRHLVDTYPDIKPDLVDCLLGDLFMDFTRLFEELGHCAKLPQPLRHGRPLPSEVPA